MCIETPKTLKMLIQLIIKDEDILKNDVFTNILSIAVTEWRFFVHTFNGGNNRRFNLCRSGKLIDAIWHTCNIQGEKIEKNKIVWEWVLNDVNEINKVCDFELLNNIIYVEPHQRFVRKLHGGYSEDVKEYKHVIREGGFAHHNLIEENKKVIMS
jgi:hypothetical protein